MPWASPWGATSPVWRHMLEMGDMAKRMWWLSHRAQLPQPHREVSWRISPYRLVSSCIQAHLLSFPSAWWHRFRVPHLHPAGGHDIPEVGGAGGAQWPHHAVRGTSWQGGSWGMWEGPIEGCARGVWNSLCCWPRALEEAAATPEPFGFSGEPLPLFQLKKSLAASRLPHDCPLL